MKDPALTAKAGFWPSASGRFLPGLATLLFGLLVWEAVSLHFLPVFLPGPGVLVERMIGVYTDPASYGSIGITLASTFEGFAVSMLAGTAAGLLMGSKRQVAVFLDSWIMVLLTIPAVCWAFVSILTLGPSSVAPILTIALIVSPFVTLNIWEGTKAIDRGLIEMGQVYRADRRLILRKVLVPHLMPYIFASLRIALSLSWKIALVAEAFGVGGGVGQRLTYWFQDTRVDMMLAWGVGFMIIMVLIDVLVFRAWARRAFAWRSGVAT